MQEPPHSTIGTSIIPSHYSLSFEPDFQKFIFFGVARITVDINKPAKKIILHAKELKVAKVTVIHNGIEYKAKPAIDEKEETLSLSINKPLKGKAILEIIFTGKHNDGMYGFYRSKYHLQGKENYLLTTQFEPANARAAFPCFDEPAFKATFDVTLTVPEHLFPISNMLIKEEKKLPARKKQVVFHTTPIMSTYLLYLGVGPFEQISTKAGKILIRVLTTPDKIHLAPLALGYTKKFLQFFEQYFNIPYPLPKVDIIAIPDFASGAMENWGAITFREIAVLGDEHTSVFVKQNIAITVAHELAHQWFGNLVTMQWWNDLWLNESFATFMSYKAVNAVFPEWELPLQYFEDTIADALSADQLESTHPINVTVKTPGEIDEIFDRISYDKGGSILHMLEDFVSERTFQRGLTRYLKEHAYKNATKDDLWNAIQQAHGEVTLAKLMHDWITQPGYPLVTVAKTAKGIELSQERFTLLPKHYLEQWRIPVRMLLSAGKPARELIVKKQTTLMEKTEWIKLNYGQHGFYRVHYPANILAHLGHLIQIKKLSSIDAAGIANDLFALTLSGSYSIREYLAFIETHCLEAEYPLCSIVSSHLNWLYRMSFKKEFLLPIKRVSTRFHSRLLSKLGWQRQPNEKNTFTILRGSTIASLGLMNNPEVLRKSSELFEAIKKGEAVDANLRGAVYVLAAWQGNVQTYSYLLERYKKETLPEESRKLLRSLSMFKDPELQVNGLGVSQSSTVRLQDSIVIPASLAGNPTVDNQLLWKWTKENWPSLKKKYQSGTHMLPVFVHNFSFVDERSLKEEITRFFTAKENYRDDIKMAIKQVTERMEVNVRFMEKNRR